MDVASHDCPYNWYHYSQVVSMYRQAPLPILIIFLIYFIGYNIYGPDMQASDGWYWKWLAKWRRKGEEIGVREMGELTQKEREVSRACVISAIFKQLGQLSQMKRGEPRMRSKHHL
jgi:hypothetical protein